MRDSRIFAAEIAKKINQRDTKISPTVTMSRFYNSGARQSVVMNTSLQGRSLRRLETKIRRSSLVFTLHLHVYFSPKSNPKSLDLGCEYSRKCQRNLSSKEWWLESWNSGCDDLVILLTSRVEDTSVIMYQIFGLKSSWW